MMKQIIRNEQDEIIHVHYFGWSTQKKFVSKLQHFKLGVTSEIKKVAAND